MTKANVVDISSFQPAANIDFNQWKSAGIDGVVIKLTEGTTYTNPEAKEQIRKAKAAGIKVNCYHFFHGNGNSVSIAEAKFFVQSAKNHGIGSEAVMVCDVESPSNSGNRAQLTSDINAFLQTIKDSGYPNVDTYANLSWFSSRINKGDLISANIWLAQYSSAAGMKCGMWQFCSDGSLPGYYGNLDLNIDYNGFYTGKTTGGNSGSVPESNNSSSGSSSGGSTYTVVSGDSLSVIGEKVGVNWQTIASINGINSPYVIQPGQVLKLSGSASSGNSSSGGSTYTVVSGDSLSVIGEKVGVNWQTIASINGINSPYVIQPGQVLKLSGSASSGSSSRKYTVVSGDSLSVIGEKVGVNWQTIASKNGISSPYIIQPGQVLEY